MNSQSPAAVTAAISEIASDNNSGALEILGRAGAVFSLLRASNEPRAEGVEHAQRGIITACAGLVRAQPEMGPMLRLASAVLSAVKTATSASKALESAEDEALRFIKTAEIAAFKASSNAACLIANYSTVLTHSRSSTVLAALTEARRAGCEFSVIATESRPAMEGRALASELTQQGVCVTLIADAAASLLMDTADLLLVGADKITPTSLTNKIGTRMIALAAQERGLHAHAICDTSKFISADYAARSHHRERPAGELWANAPQGVTIVNRYFEPVPLSYFTKIITEEGILSSEEAARRAEEATIQKDILEALESQDSVR